MADDADELLLELGAPVGHRSWLAFTSVMRQFSSRARKASLMDSSAANPCDTR